MKKHKILIAVLFVFAFILSSCEGDLENVLTIRNLSQSNLKINFRANYYEVPAGVIYNIEDIPSGIYQYSTVYEVPAGANSYNADGDVGGEIDFRQGTKVLIIYSSTFTDSAYNLFATLTTSLDLGEEENPTEP